MAKKKQTLGTFYIPNGVVIDHALPDTGLDMAAVLKKALGKVPLNISENFPTRKRKGEGEELGRKDRITIPIEYESGPELDNKLQEYIEELSSNKLLIQLSLISPVYTISFIERGSVLKTGTGEKDQRKALIPPEIRDLVRCPNDNCITNAENVPKRVCYTKAGGEHRFTCHYCETSFGFEDLRGKGLLTYMD